MDRRTFLTTLAAAVAAPSLSLPNGWFWEGGTLVIEGLTIDARDGLDLREYTNILIRNCHITTRWDCPDGIQFPDDGTIHIEHCTIVGETGWGSPGRRTFGGLTKPFTTPALDTLLMDFPHGQPPWRLYREYRD